MAASKKTTKLKPTKKKSEVKSTKTIPLPKGNPPTKKPVAAVARRSTNRGSRVASTAAITQKTTRKPRKPKITPQPEWRITFVFGNSTGVFGLASDQRIYRWNTRSALWVLHKEGLSATQQ